MKNLIPYCCAIAIAFGFSSCKKDDDKDDDDKKVVVDPVTKTLNTVPEFYSENSEENYGSTEPEFFLIANSDLGIDGANDLEFVPDESRKNELWVLSPGTLRDGGTTFLIHDAGEANQRFERIKDGNAWHFMAQATGIAFGDNGNFGTSQGILDANQSGGQFTGPSLWSADLDIYAQVGNPPTSQVNGSHLDMLHQSPFGMGIAHEKDNIYWIFDGYYSCIVKYDFAQPHYPGGYDHSDGMVWRYKDVEVAKDPNSIIPSHMELDKETNMLYIAVTGNNNVIKMDITSGTAKDVPTIPVQYNEPLALYREMENTSFEIVASGFDKPSGLAIHENRLFIGNYETGEIVCLDKDSGEELARIETQGKGLTGLCIGPKGKLWYANDLNDEIYRIDPAPVSLP